MLALLPTSECNLTCPIQLLIAIGGSCGVAREKCFTNDMVYEGSNSRSRIRLDRVQAHTPDLKLFHPRSTLKGLQKRTPFQHTPTFTTLNLSLSLHPSFQAPLFKPPSKVYPYIAIQKGPPSFINHRTPILGVPLILTLFLHHTLCTLS